MGRRSILIRRRALVRRIGVVRSGFAGPPPRLRLAPLQIFAQGRPQPVLPAVLTILAALFWLVGHGIGVAIEALSRNVNGHIIPIRMEANR